MKLNCCVSVSVFKKKCRLRINVEKDKFHFKNIFKFKNILKSFKKSYFHDNDTNDFGQIMK